MFKLFNVEFNVLLHNQNDWKMQYITDTYFYLSIHGYIKTIHNVLSWRWMSGWMSRTQWFSFRVTLFPYSRWQQQYTGGLTNTALANETVSNGCTPYKKCSCPHELFKQRTHMVSWFHLISLVIFHLISAEAGDRKCSLFEKLIWTWAFFVRDWLTLRTRWSCSSSFLKAGSLSIAELLVAGTPDSTGSSSTVFCQLSSLSDVKFKISC